MNDCVDALQQLFKDMEHALVMNDIDAVQHLTEQQHVVIRQLVEEVKHNPGLKEKAKSQQDQLQQQLDLNQRLIEQALHFTNSQIVTLLQKGPRKIYKA